MRAFSYWVCFTLVAEASLVKHATWPMSSPGLGNPEVTFVSLASLFGSLVPPMFAFRIPSFIVIALGYVMLFLVARRLWLLITKRQGVPHSFAGVSKVLGYVGAWSFLLAVVVLLLTMALRAGSSVPAAMLAIPATFCVPWAFFLAEAMSFRGVKRGEV